MLTQNDIRHIEDLLDKKLEEKFNEKLKYLPNKEEFYSKMDELMTEIKAMREEQELHAGQHTEINDTLQEHEEHIRKLAKRVGISL